MLLQVRCHVQFGLGCKIKGVCETVSGFPDILINDEVSLILQRNKSAWHGRLAMPARSVDPPDHHCRGVP